MLRTGRILAISLILLTTTLTASTETSSSCLFSNSVDQGHHDHDHHSHDHPHSHMVTPAPDHDHGRHDHAHDHDHSHHSHDHHHSHMVTPAPDHDHGHHGHDHDHDHSHHDCGHGHHHHEHALGHTRVHKLAEELAEEEELRLYGFESKSHSEEGHHHEHALPSLGLWVRALGCSLLVSMASLICLIVLPLIVAQGKPSRLVVDFLAAFGAGAMLGDAFLHQLPHALVSSNGHSHGHNHEHTHHGHHHPHVDGMGLGDVGGHGHAHSMQDLSVGLAVLAGIILFFIVEKIVRQVEKSSVKKAFPWAHHHHHHHQELDDDPKHHQDDDGGKAGQKEDDSRDPLTTNGSEEQTQKLYRRKKMADIQKQIETTPLVPDKCESTKNSTEEDVASSNLILGYLNLFSDGVHNFTDGMALGAAFLNHGTVGGWSRTLFLLAHELPQEVGDFGILVQSGFSVVKALAFNFLSALVALAGTAMALLLGGSPEHSSLIEGFTAGGFIYIAVAGVLPEMQQNGTTVRATLLQLAALSLGMSVALYISLVE